MGLDRCWTVRIIADKDINWVFAHPCRQDDSKHRILHGGVVFIDADCWKVALRVDAIHANGTRRSILRVSMSCTSRMGPDLQLVRRVRQLSTPNTGTC